VVFSAGRGDFCEAAAFGWFLVYREWIERECEEDCFEKYKGVFFLLRFRSSMIALYKDTHYKHLWLLRSLPKSIKPKMLDSVSVIQLLY
jgi:hypothetical protein